MNLKDLLKFLHKNYFDILSMSVFFGILGLVIYFLLPTKYIASGEFFIGRNIQPVDTQQNVDSFSYEGYYAQQNALSYTANIEGILDSDFTRSEVLKQTGTPANSYNMRNLDKKIRVKRTAPQIVEVQIRDTNPQKAMETWLALTNITENISSDLNSQGDPNIFVKRINQTPVLKEAYKNPFVNFAGGIMIGAFLATFVLALEEYWKVYKSEIIVSSANTAKTKKRK